MRLVVFALVVAVIQLTFAGTGQASEQLRPKALSFSDGYLRTMPPGQKVTAAFISVTNVSDEDCRLTSLSSPLANRVEFHQHQHVDGMMKMRPMKSVLVAAGNRVVFKPGAFHIMFFNVGHPLMAGHKTALTLATDQCGDYSAELEIRGLVKTKITDHH
ncbi:MAG: copper chaperone PCu(A)C [Porticoccaceae bacterium]